MEIFQTTMITVLSVVSLAFLGLLALLAREVGVMLTRLGPTGPRPMPDLAPVGEAIDDFELGGNGDETVVVQAAKRALLIIVASSCPVCTDLLPRIGVVAASPPRPTQVVVIACRPEDSVEHIRAKVGRANVPVIGDPQVCARFGVQGWPYAILLENGAVHAKGIVNDLQQVEGLYGLIRYVRDGADERPPSEQAQGAEVSDHV